MRDQLYPFFQKQLGAQPDLLTIVTNYGTYADEWGLEQLCQWNTGREAQLGDLLDVKQCGFVT